MLHAVDYRTPAISRRTFLQAAGLALVSRVSRVSRVSLVAARFTSIAGGFLDWLTRICSFDTALQGA